VDNPRTQKKSSLPSWLTDWQGIWESTSANVCSRIKSRGMNSGYLACGRSKHFMKLSGNGLNLIARGYFFGRVGHLSPWPSRREPSFSLFCKM
jgi:hypothetical protein